MSTESFQSTQSVSSEQTQSLNMVDCQPSEVLISESKLSSISQKSSDAQISSIEGENCSNVSSSNNESTNVSSPYNLPPQVSARSLLSELEAPPSPLVISSNNTNNNNTSMQPGATPWAPATTSSTATDGQPEPLNLGPTSFDLPLGASQPPSTASSTSTSGFQLQRPRQFQPSPATARRLLNPPPSPNPPQKVTAAPERNSPAANSSSSSDLAVQFGQQ